MFRNLIIHLLEAAGRMLSGEFGDGFEKPGGLRRSAS
jgi:hypothetical protein